MNHGGWDAITVWSPDAAGLCTDYTLVSQATVTECHAQGFRIIPWTINEIVILYRMKSWGCDGGITDFPDVVR